LDPQDFGFLDPDLQKYADPRIWIQRVKNQPKTAKKTFLLLKSKSELLKKSFRLKISEKNETKYLKLFFVKKISKSY